MNKLLYLSLGIAVAIGATIVYADSEYNTSGFAWSENIGWISFNSETQFSGFSWERTDLTSGTRWHDAFGGYYDSVNDKYLVVGFYDTRADWGTQAKVWVSSNLSSWVEYPMTSANDWNSWGETPKKIIYDSDHSRYVAVGEIRNMTSSIIKAAVWYSSDLVNWTISVINEPVSNWVAIDILYDSSNSKYVVSGMVKNGTDNYNAVIWESTNLSTWTRRNLDTPTTRQVANSVIKVGSNYIVAGYRGAATPYSTGTVWTSTDLVYWTKKEISTNTTGTDIIYDSSNSKYIFLGQEASSPGSIPVVWESSDLNTWTKRSMAAASSLYDSGRSLIYNSVGGKYLVAGWGYDVYGNYEGYVWESSDLISWTRESVETSSGNHGVSDIILGNSDYLVVGYSRPAGLDNKYAVVWEKPFFSAGVSYGINVNTGNGKLSGYAWSEVGWISFNRSETGTPPSDDACPDATCIAKATPSGQLGVSDVPVTGWARALSYGDGWDGWIKFGQLASSGLIFPISLPASFPLSTDFSGFETKIDSSGNWQGWAWGSDVIGWVSFNGVGYSAITELDNDSAPTAVLDAPSEGYCSFPTPSMNFSWIYSDSDGDNESRFQFQIDTNAGFSSPDVDRDFTGLSNPSGSVNSQIVNIVPLPVSDQLAYSTNYHWRIKVYDESGKDSGWISGQPFTTKAHRCPYVEFSWSPSNPLQDEQVQFTNESICYSSDSVPVDCPPNAYSWTFEDGEPEGSTAKNPLVKFSERNQKNVVLQVTDADGNVCSRTKAIEIKSKPPIWKEIIPWLSGLLFNLFK